MGSEMNQDPNRPGTGSAGEPPEELMAVDAAMMVALTHRPRTGNPLTADQEFLLDRWVSGQLSPSDMERAVELTKQNFLAAERVLERRLIAAADESPEVPAALSSRVLQAVRPKERASATAAAAPAAASSFWSALSAWQWSGLGAAVAATLVIAVVGMRMWHEQPKSYKLMQFAMVTIDDRGGVGSSRVRSLQPEQQQQQQQQQSGYHDTEMPTDLLRRTIADVAGRGSVSPSEWTKFLPEAAQQAANTQVLIDRSVSERILSGDWKSRNAVPVRIYDLADPRWSSIRSQVGRLPADTRALLVTQRQ
jgi:hypothetical protein